MKFTLIEGETDFSDIYNEFKQDFLNPNLLRSEIMKKFNLSENEYRKIRKQVVKETGVAAKPNKYHPVIPCETSYIHKSKSKWMIVKYVDGKKKFFGTYDDLRVAMLIRDELIKYNWDKSELEKIRNRIFTDLRDEYFKTLQNIWNILNRFHEEFHLSDKISFAVPSSGARRNMIIVTVHDIERYEDDLKSWLDCEDTFKSELNIKCVDVEQKESLNNNYNQYDISYIYSGLNKTCRVIIWIA